MKEKQDRAKRKRDMLARCRCAPRAAACPRPGGRAVCSGSAREPCAAPAATQADLYGEVGPGCAARRRELCIQYPVDRMHSELPCALSDACSLDLAGRRQDAEDGGAEGEEVADEAARSAQARRSDAKGRKGKPRLIF